jgi:hypothetical protein
LLKKEGLNLASMIRSGSLLNNEGNMVLTFDCSGLFDEYFG